MHPCKGCDQIGLQVVERPGGRCVDLANQNVVPAILTVLGKAKAGDLAQASLGPVPGDSVANFFGASVADPNPLERFIGGTLACL